MPLSSETSKSLFDDLNNAPPAEAAPAVAETPTPVATETPVSQPPATAVETQATETPVETAAAPAANPFLTELQQLGFQDVADEETARQRLLESYRTERQRREQYEAQAQQSAPLVQYGRQYLEQMHDPQFQQFVAQRQTRTSAPPAEEKKPWWSPPEYNATVAERYREYDATGQVKWKENTPAEVRAGHDSYQTYVQNWAEQLVRDPVKALDGFRQSVLEEAQQLIQRDFQETQQKQTEQSFVQQVERDNSEWLYQRDPRTNQVQLDINGSPQTSAWGQRAMEYVAEANKMGIPSAEGRWQYAVARVKSDYADAVLRQQQPTTPTLAAAPVPPATIEQTIANTRQNILERGRVNTANLPAANRTGSEDRVDAPSRRSQNSKLSPGRRLLADLKRNG